jgi:hypothetical protein
MAPRWKLKSSTRSMLQSTWRAFSTRLAERCTSSTKTLAVITKDTFRGHHSNGNSAEDYIIPTQYGATGVVPGFIRDQAEKYWRTCGATVDKFSAGDADAAMDTICTSGCRMLALWADLYWLSGPSYRAFRTWLLDATTANGGAKNCTV